MFIYQREDWPNFTWDQAGIAGLLAGVRYRQGRLEGRLEGLSFSLQDQAALKSLTLDVVKTSEIEGEVLNLEQVGYTYRSDWPVHISAQNLRQALGEVPPKPMPPLSRDIELPLA